MVLRLVFMPKIETGSHRSFAIDNHNLRMRMGQGARIIGDFHFPTDLRIIHDRQASVAHMLEDIPNLGNQSREGKLWRVVQ